MLKILMNLSIYMLASIMLTIKESLFACQESVRIQNLLMVELMVDFNNWNTIKPLENCSDT